MKHLTIGRRISEYMSKSNNARLRLKAYKCFIDLVESDKKDFAEVWRNRASSPRKLKERQRFLTSLRVQSARRQEKLGKAAVELLWLLEGTAKKSPEHQE